MIHTNLSVNYIGRLLVYAAQDITYINKIKSINKFPCKSSQS